MSDYHELLSAYLDDELEVRERVAVDAALGQSADLRETSRSFELHGISCAALGRLSPADRLTEHRDRAREHRQAHGSGL